MTPPARRFLEHLAEPDFRALHVEALRFAASLLDGTAPPMPEPMATELRFRAAGELRAAASMLCDHARVEGRRCRYCESEVPG